MYLSVSHSQNNLVSSAYIDKQNHNEDNDFDKNQFDDHNHDLNSSRSDMLASSDSDAAVMNHSCDLNAFCFFKNFKI